MRLRVEDIVFLILMLLGLGLLVWKLFGSPSLEPVIAVLIGGMFTLVAEVHMRFGRIEGRFGKIDVRLSNIETKLDLIWNEFKNRNKI